MKKLTKLLAIVCTLAFVLTACSSGSGGNSGGSKSPGTAKDGNEVAIEKASMDLVQAVDKSKYKLVSTEELKKWVDNKEDMIIVDTMPEKNFKKNRIPGAVNAELPVKMEEVKPEAKDAFLKQLGNDKNKKIVIYCGFVGCARSDVGAILAQEAGYTNVYRQPGGIIAWLDAGYDVESN